MAEVRIPSAQLDNVREDRGDATRGTVDSASAEPFALADGDTLTVVVDGGAAQTVTFRAVDFDDLGAARADEVARVLTAQLAGAEAFPDPGGSGRVTLATLTWGAAGSIQVTGGTANATLGFPTTAAAGVDPTPLALVLARVPEPGEEGVPVGTRLRFAAFDPAGAPALADVTVEVDGATVLSGGTASPGWTVTTSVPVPTWRIVELTPPGLFADSSTVTVRAVVAGASSTADETWTFTTEDLTPPSVVSAEMVGPRTLRVRFSEAVRALGDGDPGDALNLARYAVATAGAPDEPAFLPALVSAAPATGGGPEEVDLVFAAPLSFRDPYELTVDGVEDVAGNAMPAPETVAFSGFAPSVPAARAFDLWTMLPAVNRREDEDRTLRRVVSAWQDIVDLLLYELDRWPTILDPDEAPEPFLERMLRDLGNPFAFVALDDATRRKLARALVDIYRGKGTAKGIADAAQFLLGLTITFETFGGTGLELAASDSPTLDAGSPPAGPGSPLPATGEPEPAGAAGLGTSEPRLLYSFVVRVDRALSAAERENLIRLVEYMKPAHTHLLRVEEPGEAPAGLSGAELGGGALSGVGVLGSPPWTLSGP